MEYPPGHEYLGHHREFGRVSTSDRMDRSLVTLVHPRVILLSFDGWLSVQVQANLAGRSETERGLRID